MRAFRHLAAQKKPARESLRDEGTKIIIVIIFVRCFPKNRKRSQAVPCVVQLFPLFFLAFLVLCCSSPHPAAEAKQEPRAGASKLRLSAEEQQDSGSE